MSKKLLSIFALFVLILALAPADALAQGGITGILAQEGNSLSEIAEKLYGDRQGYLDIVKYNNLQAEKYKLFTKISDPNVIEVGQIIALPDHVGVSKYMLSTDGVVSLPEVNLLEGGITSILIFVQEGNSLSEIAEKLYGDRQTYPGIVKYNNLQAKIYKLFTEISDPNVIEVDQIIASPYPTDVSKYMSKAGAGD